MTFTYLVSGRAPFTAITQAAGVRSGLDVATLYADDVDDHPLDQRLDLYPTYDEACFVAELDINHDQRLHRPYEPLSPHAHVLKSTRHAATLVSGLFSLYFDPAEAKAQFARFTQAKAFFEAHADILALSFDQAADCSAYHQTSWDAPFPQNIADDRQAIIPHPSGDR